MMESRLFFMPWQVGTAAVAIPALTGASGGTPEQPGNSEGVWATNTALNPAQANLRAAFSPLTQGAHAQVARLPSLLMGAASLLADCMQPSRLPDALPNISPQTRLAAGPAVRGCACLRESPSHDSFFLRTFLIRVQYLARILHLLYPELFACLSIYIRLSICLRRSLAPLGL